VSIPGQGTSPFPMDDLCHTQPFVFIRLLSVAVIEVSTTKRSVTNRYPIADILPFTSIVEIVFNRLSNVHLPGIVTRPQAIASLRLYLQSIIRKVCNALLESSRNHIRTIKHLKITVVGEYTYGLPRFLLGILGHGIQPIRYRT
jgi:hypothetical protein